MSCSMSAIRTHRLWRLDDSVASAGRDERQMSCGPLATRRERALAGDVVGSGDRSFDRLQLGLALSGRRLRQQQSERVGVGRRPLDVAAVARLEDRAGVQHVDAVAHREGDAQVVRDEDHAHPTGHLGAPQQVEDLGLGGDVERGRRFVGEQQLRVAGQRRGEGDPLAHPTGQLERVPVDDAGIVDAHLGQASDRRRPPGGPRMCPPDWSRRPSTMCLPQRSSGFSEVNGSWNSSVMRSPRYAARPAGRGRSTRCRRR